MSLAEIPLAVWMLAALFAGLFTGYPVALVLAGVSIVFALIGGVPERFFQIGVLRIDGGILSNWLLVAIPLFVLMGLMLEKSGIAARLLRSLAALFRTAPGGYAFSVAFIGIILAASTGIVGASVVLLGLLAFPQMQERQYDPRIASGIIAASGTLGILIPPSIMLIILGDTLRVSVGDLFTAALVPGLLLGGAYVAYIALLAWLRPESMPAGAQPASSAGLWQTLLNLGMDLLLPLALIIAVLGSIISGLATPTESAGLGALGATLLAFASNRLRLADFLGILFATTKTTAMIAFVMIGATLFSVVFRKLGGDDLIAEWLHGSAHGDIQVLLTIMLVTFILGMFLDWIEISLVMLPLVAPVVTQLDFGLPPDQMLLWFAIMFAVNLQTSFLTPPFGYSLFYLKGIAPPEIPIRTIYAGVAPFVLLQLLVLALIIAFPALSIGLPQWLGGS